jgi:hypothetical protein
MLLDWKRLEMRIEFSGTATWMTDMEIETVIVMSLRQFG